MHLYAMVSPSIVQQINKPRVAKNIKGLSFTFKGFWGKEYVKHEEETEDDEG